MNEKLCDEMEFDEFVKWAQEYVVEEFLNNGLKGIKQSIRMVVVQMVQNTSFGGKSNKKLK